jgi:hypothetical protein
MICRRMTIVSGSSLLAASLWVIAGDLPRSTAAEIPEPVRQALESNAKALNPITITWKLKRSSDLPARRAESLIGATGIFFQPREGRLMWDNGKFYSYLGIELGPPPSDKMVVEITFDGGDRYCVTKSGGKGPPVALKDPLSELVANDQDISFVDKAFLLQVGFRIPDQVKEYEAKQPAKSLPLYLVEHGARVVEVGSEEVDGVKCMALALRADKREIRFALDPAKGYAVRRYTEWTRPGALASRAVCSDFTQLPNSALWIPRKVEVEWHIWPPALVQPVKEAVFREAFQILELNNEPIPTDRFVLNFDKPGTYVGDSSIKGPEGSDFRIGYRVPANPADLDEVIKAATTPRYQPKLRFKTAFFLGNALVILVVVGLAWWRLRTKPA